MTNREACGFRKGRPTPERAVAPPQALVEYHVGTRIPANAPLYAVPQDVAVEVPAIRSYKYMVVNG